MLDDRTDGKSSVTLYDVAKRAGVSHQTVSRVVNNLPHVSASTRERVLLAIQEIGYTPDRVARILSTGRSQIIQIVSIRMTHLYPLEAMLHTARRLGYDTAFSIVEDPSSEDELRERLCSLAPQLIDGLIVITPSGEVSTRKLVDVCPSVPMVLIGPEAGASAPSVIIDQGYGTRLALQHLHDLGHQRIVEICGPLVFHDAMARHQAYLRFMETHSLEPLTASEDPNWMPESGYRRVSLLLQRKTRFTALFCANDLIALGALRALHENGLSVPEDVSVVGFDDASSAEYYIPPLTTVKQDFPAQGREAVQYLVQLIEESPTSVHRRVLDPQLIVRSSTSKVG